MQQNRETLDSLHRARRSRINERLRAPRGIAEVLLIALGIVLGLSGEAWLEARGDRRLEAEYLNDLRQEFETSRAHLISVLEREETRQESGETLIRASLESTLIADDGEGARTGRNESHPQWNVSHGFHHSIAGSGHYVQHDDHGL